MQDASQGRKVQDSASLFGVTALDQAALGLTTAMQNTVVRSDGDPSTFDTFIVRAAAPRLERRKNYALFVHENRSPGCAAA